MIALADTQRSLWLARAALLLTLLALLLTPGAVQPSAVYAGTYDVFSCTQPTTPPRQSTVGLPFPTIQTCWRKTTVRRVAR